MYQRSVESYLHPAGIMINGSNPWDIQVHQPKFFERVVMQGTLGLGESYMDGWWDCDGLDELVFRTVHIYPHGSVRGLLQKACHFLFNLQSKSRAFIVGQKHYDLGNDLFERMLDKRMTYSCAYWKNASNLDEAQEAKLELICRKIYLKPGMKVLDIGCGWGSFAKYAAEKYGVEVVGITVSEKQLELARQRCRGLPIEFRLQDYRDVTGIFDRIVSVGQMEHVGEKNYGTYMKVVKRSLKKDGLFLLHTIGNNVSYHGVDPWISKYIFPNGQIPGMKQLIQKSADMFVMEDWHNFGAYYDPTLMAWHENVKKNWDQLKANYDERFYRMWTFYLLTCAGMFRARQLQLWQIVFSPAGVPDGYQSQR